MAVIDTTTYTPGSAILYGRSGYNKSGDDDTPRSLSGPLGLNRAGDDDDETSNAGRSGYN
ncbi:uncharacterized protein DNG_03535 [Cephalotrichum gorgonifer]|uniref:Uncharacterized protein n=1 Tax=Cephalotrichum gorgonifer TaxID=2041049 RepID=A0AAE8MW91_9PEZI|nr:uncharacterized protein DNG_03535 [Cephalotrichum gorgonifer]